MINLLKKLKTPLKVVFFISFALILIIGGLYLYAFLSPKISIKTSGKYYIYDKYNELVYQGSSSSEWINLDDIADNMKKAIISTEDKRFYKHKGFDYPRIMKAIINNIKSKHVVEGASTISQQYVKNLYLTFDKTWKRKMEEAMLTLELEVHYSKDEILEGYLNTINFGQGNYGVEEAAKYYFNKSSKDLTLEESCILAGIPKSPANYNPVSNYDASIKRAKVVAYSMYKNKYITKEDYNSMYKDVIPIYAKREKNNLQTLLYYQDAVINELKSIKSIPDSIIDSGGLKIYTDLDLNIQANLEKAVLSNMKDDDVQVAALYVDPTNGAVNALVGGKDYSKSQYNRAIKSARQVGSTIKPFLYYGALSNGLTMASVFTSEKTTFNVSGNKEYSPSNYNDIYANKGITMAAALAYSDNIFAVKTHLFLGSDVLVNTMKTMGLKKKLESIPSLALGTIEINMVDYAKAYSALASGGYDREIHLIEKVEDAKGNILYERKKKDLLLLNYNYVYIINEMMKNAYNPVFIDYNSPTAIALKGRLSHDYSIKTGTTDNDHWIVGYNPNALLMVWTGSDDNKTESIGYSKITKNIWADAMEESLKDINTSWYEKPQNVVALPLNPITAEFGTNKNTLFYFVKGTEPTYEFEEKNNNH